MEEVVFRLLFWRPRAPAGESETAAAAAPPGGPRAGRTQPEAEAAKTCFAAEFKTSQVFTTQHTATARIVWN